MGSKGQSLIESLVALTILVVGIMGAVSLGIYTVRGAQASQDDIIAINLAQEGLEGVRWIRDHNWKIGDQWETGITIPNNYTLGRLEVNSPAAAIPFEFNAVPGGESWETFCTLCFDEDTGKYFHIGSGFDCEKEGYVNSGLKRLIITKPSDPGDPEMFTVGAIIYQGAKEYALIEEFYDWWP